VKTGITVIAYMTAKSGHEDRVGEALLELVAQTRKEKGCITYDLHQSPENAAQFVMYENWEVAADLDAHAKAAPLQNFVKTAGSLLERPAEIRQMDDGLKPRQTITMMSDSTPILEAQLAKSRAAATSTIRIRIWLQPYRSGADQRGFSRSAFPGGSVNIA